MAPPTSVALPLNVTPSVTPARTSTSPISVNGNQTMPPAATKPLPTSSEISSPHELTAFVETLLEQLDAKFEDMSVQILDRMMQMSSRVDSLEASIQDIINGDNAGSVPSLPQSPVLQRKGGA